MAKLRSLFNRVFHIASAFSDRGLPTYATSCAFYSFLSLFPLTALAASLLPCVGIPRAALVDLFQQIAPASVASLLKTIVGNVYTNVFPALPLSLLALLWSSARAFSELLRGMNAMVAPGSSSGFLRRRLRGVLLTLALLTSLLLSLGVLIFGSRLVSLLGTIYPGLSDFLTYALWLRYLVMAFVLWLLFVFLYRSIPEQLFTFREVRTGAAAAAIAWIVFSALFSLFAGRFMDLTLYGSMATMVLTMLWLFYCQYIILAGVLICTRKHEKLQGEA